MSKITRYELLELESKPKTKTQLVFDYIVCFLPITMGVLSLTEYYYIPSIRPNKNSEIYAIFIGCQILAFSIALIISFFYRPLFSKIRHKAPLYTLVFLIYTAYDYLTLKTGVLILPYFPWVNQVLNAAINDRAYLLDCIKNSLILLFTGYGIGAGIGIITGILCGYSKKINYWVAPFMRLLGPIPSTTWLPLVMVLVSSLFKGAVFIIALGVWFSTTLATITGIHNIDRDFFAAAKTLGAKGHQLVSRIAIPAALPNIFQGLTQGMSSACTALLVAEMLGVESGLGWYITWQKSWAEFAKMYAAIVIICLTFIAVYQLLNKIKRSVLKWQEG
nr:ABC transporter permease subunit [Treponema denticola]